VLVGLLRLMLANIHTETSVAAIKNYQTHAPTVRCPLDVAACVAAAVDCSHSFGGEYAHFMFF